MSSGGDGRVEYGRSAVNTSSHARVLQYNLKNAPVFLGFNSGKRILAESICLLSLCTNNELTGMLHTAVGLLHRNLSAMSLWLTIGQTIDDLDRRCPRRTYVIYLPDQPNITV